VLCLEKRERRLRGGSGGAPPLARKERQTIRDELLQRSRTDGSSSAPCRRFEHNQTSTPSGALRPVQRTFSSQPPQPIDCSKSTGSIQPIRLTLDRTAPYGAILRRAFVVSEFRPQGLVIRDRSGGQRIDFKGPDVRSHRNITFPCPGLSCHPVEWANAPPSRRYRRTQGAAADKKDARTYTAYLPENHIADDSVIASGLKAVDAMKMVSITPTARRRSGARAGGEEVSARKRTY